MNPPAPETAFYGEPLAGIHDRYYGQVALDAAAKIDGLLQGSDPSSQYIIDLGCGSGILEKELSEKGFPVLGVDISPGMLHIAREKAPNAHFVQSSLFDFSIPPCTLVAAIGEAVCYLGEEKDDNDPAIKVLTRNIYEQLAPGGYFIFDVLSTLAEEPATRMIEKPGLTMFIEISIDRVRQVLSRKMTFFVKQGEAWLKQQETHRQQLFDKDWLETLLQQSGFRVQVVDRYHEEPFRRGHLGFICRKEG